MASASMPSEPACVRACQLPNLTLEASPAATVCSSPPVRGSVSLGSLCTVWWLVGFQLPLSMTPVWA